MSLKGIMEWTSPVLRLAKWLERHSPSNSLERKMDSGRGRTGRNRNVFKGTVLVSILLESHPRRFKARASAVKFAKRLLREGVICSIFGSRSFEDSAQLYMWQDDDAIRRHRTTMTSSGPDGVTTALTTAATATTTTTTTTADATCHTTASVTPSSSQQQQLQERLIRESQQRAGYESLRRVEETSEPRYERLDSRLIEDVKRRVLNRSEAYNIVTSYNTFFQELQRDFVPSSETGAEKDGSEHNYYNDPLPPRQNPQQQQQQHQHHQQYPPSYQPGDRGHPPPYHRTSERQQEVSGGLREHPRSNSNKLQHPQQQHHYQQQQLQQQQQEYPPPPQRPRRHNILPEASRQLLRQHQQHSHQQQQQQQAVAEPSARHQPQQHQTYRATPRQTHPHHALVPPTASASSPAAAATATTTPREPAHRHQQQQATPTSHHSHRHIQQQQSHQPRKYPQGQDVSPPRPPRDVFYSSESSSYQDPTYASVGTGVAAEDAKRESTCSTDSSLDTQTYFRTRDRITSKAQPQGEARPDKGGKTAQPRGGISSSSSAKPHPGDVAKSPREVAAGGKPSGGVTSSSSSGQALRAGDTQGSSGSLSVTPRTRPSAHQHQHQQQRPAAAAHSGSDPPLIARSQPVHHAYTKMASPLGTGPAQPTTPPQQQASRGVGDPHPHHHLHHNQDPRRSSDPPVPQAIDSKDREAQLLRPEMTSSSDFELTSAGMPGFSSSASAAHPHHHLNHHQQATTANPGGGGLTSSSSNHFESSSSPEHMTLVPSGGGGLGMRLGDNHHHLLQHNHHHHSSNSHRHHHNSNNPQAQGSSGSSSSRSGTVVAVGAGGDGGGVGRGVWAHHDPTVACSYSDNEKQLIEEMKRMKKEHQDILRTYEGRINKLMAKMHELRNIAEMLENSSTSKVAPYGLLPAKATLLNIIASGTKLDDTDKKGLTSAGDGDVPPPLPPRPGRGGRIYPNKPILHTRTRMKSLHWNRIILGDTGTDGAPTTVWHGMTDAKFDTQEVERLYSSPPDSTSDDVTLLDDIYAARGRPKHQLIAMFDAERSQRVLTEMRNLRCTLNDIISAITSLDCHHLHQDSFAELLELLNCPRDVDKILHHVKRKGPGQLDTAEFLIFEMSKLDHFRERLEFLRFKNKLQINLFEIDQQLRELNTACDELVNNLPLKNVLETVLAVGNYLNAGTERGQADGFGLDVLNKLKDFADRSRRGNLLELIMRTYCLQYEADLDLGCPTRFRLPEPSNMRHAAQVSFEEIQKALRDLREELSQVRDRLEVLSKRETSNLTIALRVTSENFLTSAVEVLAEEKRFLEDTKGHFWKTASHFLYNRQCTPQEFFQTWATFLHDCKYYWKLAHRNLARDKFERDFSTKCQLSCSSLPGFTNLKNKMMRTVETLQNDQEMRVSKAQQLQHINNWIESLGKYDQELGGGGGGGGLAGQGAPHGVVRDNTYGNDLSTGGERRGGRQPPRQSHSKHREQTARGGAGGGGGSHHHPHHHHQQQQHPQGGVRPSSPKPITSTPPNVHKPQAISHASPTTVSSTYSSTSFPNNNTNNHLLNSNNDDNNNNDAVPIIAPYASSGDNFLLNSHNYHQAYLSDVDAVDEPYESLSRAAMAMVAHQHQQQYQPEVPGELPPPPPPPPAALSAADSVDGSKRHSQDSGHSSKKKPNLSLKSWLKRGDQRHRSSNDELSSSSPAAGASAAVSASSPNGGVPAAKSPAQAQVVSSPVANAASNTTTTTTTTAAPSAGSSGPASAPSASTPFNKLRNSVVQKFSGGGSSKKSSDAAAKGGGSNGTATASNTNTTTNTNSVSPAVPPKPPRTMVESTDLPPSHQILFTSPGHMQPQDCQLPTDFDPTDYQNCYYQAADRTYPLGSSPAAADRGSYPLLGPGACEGRGGYPSGHDSAPSTLSSVASRECSPLKYEAFARGADEASRHRDSGRDRSRYGSQDRNLNPPPSGEADHAFRKDGGGRGGSGGGGGGGGRIRAPIALNLGSNMSISDAYGRSEDPRQTRQQDDAEVHYTNNRVEGGGGAGSGHPPASSSYPPEGPFRPDAAAVAPNNAHQPLPPPPVQPPQPSTVDSKRVRAAPVPVYKAKLIPNYENQTKMDPRHLDPHAIRGQAEPVPLPLALPLSLAQPQAQSQSPAQLPAGGGGHFAQSSNSSEVYRQELQRKSELYVTSYPQSPLSQQASPNPPTTTTSGGPSYGNSPGTAGYPSPLSGGPVPASGSSPSSSSYPHSSPNQAYFQTPASPSAYPTYPPPGAYHPSQQQDGTTTTTTTATATATTPARGDGEGLGPVNSASPHYDDFQTPARRSLSAQNILDHRGGYGSDGSRQSHTSEPSGPATAGATSTTHSYLASFSSSGGGRKDETPAMVSWRDRDGSGGKPVEAPRSAPAKVSALISRWEKKEVSTAVSSASSGAALLVDGQQEKPPSMTSTPVSRRKHPPAGEGGGDGKPGPSSHHFQRSPQQQDGPASGRGRGGGRAGGGAGGRSKSQGRERGEPRGDDFSHPHHHHHQPPYRSQSPPPFRYSQQHQQQQQQPASSTRPSQAYPSSMYQQQQHHQKQQQQQPYDLQQQQQQQQQPPYDPHSPSTNTYPPRSAGHLSGTSTTRGSHHHLNNNSSNNNHHQHHPQHHHHQRDDLSRNVDADSYSDQLRKASHANGESGRPSKPVPLPRHNIPGAMAVVKPTVMHQGGFTAMEI